MKVVYRSILKEIEQAIDRANNQMRTIDHIELTAREQDEIRRELLAIDMPLDLVMNAEGDNVSVVYGVKVVVK